MVRESCVYSVFFETNIGKDTLSLPGRDKAVHPFVLDIISLTENGAVINITFIGRAVNYIPYLNIALTNAGEFGVGRNRAEFEVTGIMAGSEEFHPDIREIAKRCHIWPSETVESPHRITLVTPCRIKEQGKYLSTVTFNSLLMNMQRRVSILIDLFGDEGDSIPEAKLTDIKSLPVNQKWEEKTYYSSRQKARMQLGGVVGEIVIDGEVPSFERELTQAMELFHVGKNISFGLGKIKVEY